jgi:pteridine reductase
MDLQDRVIGLTGAARRVGRALALGLARRGAHIALHYHTSAGAARATAAEIEALGRHALPVQGDLTRPAECEAIAAKIDARFGRLDALINNASTFERMPVGTVTEADWDRALGSNLKGAFFCAQAALPLLRRGGGGCIVNIGDGAALRPYPNHLPYMVAKAGLLTMTQALAVELAPAIRVNAVAPGVVLPPEDMDDAERERALGNVPLGRFGAPEDVLAAVLYLLEGGDYVTGQVLTVDGGRSIAQPRRR